MTTRRLGIHGVMAILAAAALPEASSPESILEDKLRQRGISIDKARELAAGRGISFGLVAEELIAAHDAGRTEVMLPDLRGGARIQSLSAPAPGRFVDEVYAIGETARSEPIVPPTLRIQVWDAEMPPSTSPLPSTPRPVKAPRARDRDAQKTCRRRRADRRARRGW